MPLERMHPDDIAQLAKLLAVELREVADAPQASTVELVDAKTVAKALHLDRKTVYRRWSDLGGVKVAGSVRFDLAKALAGGADEHRDRSPSERSEVASKPAPPRRKRPQQRAATRPDCQLLPIGRAG